MSDYPNLDDTQPRPPIHAPDLEPPDVETTRSGGPGCALLGCLGVAGVGLAVVIVLLAGIAGWTTGARTAQGNATATRSASINDQLARIPQDMASGNLQLVDARIRYLMTLTPGVPGVPELMQTGTAAYLAAQPTLTRTPAPTPTEAPATEAITDQPFATEEALPSGQNGSYDLAALLQEASTDVSTAQFDDAYKLLDAISAIDPTYEAAQVKQLIRESVNGQARRLFNANKPAEAVVWATRADDMGILEGDLNFELSAATLYLNAKAAIGLNYGQAVQALQKVLDLGPGRYYAEAQSLIIDQYIGYGDALAADPNQGYCPAVPQYQNAINAGGGRTASAKRDNAQSLCAQATPVGQPTADPSNPSAPPATGAPGQIAPVGQP